MDFEIQEKENTIELIMKNGEKVLGKATCFISNTPSLKNEKIATIGDFECNSTQNGVNLLEKCCETIKEKGYK